MARPSPPLLNRSRVVSLLKMVFPLTALGLMSMIFLMADPVDPSRAIEMAEIDVEERARDPRLSAARFAGVTDDGAALRIEAGSARSDPGAALRFQVEDFALWLERSPVTERTEPARSSVTARAREGVIDRTLGQFQMSGGVRLTADPGYALNAERISGALDRTEVEVAGPIEGQAPAGTLTAGHLRITTEPGPDGTTRVQRLVFDGGVRLLYRPEE